MPNWNSVDFVMPEKAPKVCSKKKDERYLMWMRWNMLNAWIYQYCERIWEIDSLLLHWKFSCSECMALSNHQVVNIQRSCAKQITYRIPKASRQTLRGKLSVRKWYMAHPAKHLFMHGNVMKMTFEMTSWKLFFFFLWLNDK